jgi:hypothetical protein
VAPDAPAPDATPRSRFIALLDQFDQWLQAEKEQGSDSVHASPALVRSLKNPIPVAPASAGRTPAPAPSVVLFVSAPTASDEAEQLLLKMIEAMKLPRDAQVLERYGAADGPALRARLAALKPALVVTLDEDAWRGLAGPSGEPLETVRGTWQVRDGMEIMPTYGPAHLLARPADKKLAWKDLQAVMARLGRASAK